MHLKCIESHAKTSLVVPQAFIECEIRDYDKGRAVDCASEDQEVLRLVNL